MVLITNIKLTSLSTVDIHSNGIIFWTNDKSRFFFVSFFFSPKKQSLIQTTTEKNMHDLIKPTKIKIERKANERTRGCPVGCRNLFLTFYLGFKCWAPHRSCIKSLGTELLTVGVDIISQRWVSNDS